MSPPDEMASHSSAAGRVPSVFGYMIPSISHQPSILGYIESSKTSNLTLMRCPVHEEPAR